MKKVLVFLVTFIIILSFSACSLSDDSNSQSEPERVDSTTDLVSVFEGIGLTESEAELTAWIFEFIGITEISEPEAGIGTGIDELQSYKACAFGYKNVTTMFTFDQRRLCYVSFSFPDSENELTVSVDGKVKTKSSITTKTVDMYDKLDDITGEYDSDKNGYLASLDWEKRKIFSFSLN